MGVTVGEQYQQLWEAASEAERRPKKHAEEQELDQLDLDHAKQGILVDFHTHTHKKNPHNIGHQGRDDTFSKVGEKNPTTCSFGSHCKSREPNTQGSSMSAPQQPAPSNTSTRGPHDQETRAREQGLQHWMI